MAVKIVSSGSTLLLAPLDCMRYFSSNRLKSAMTKAFKTVTGIP